MNTYYMNFRCRKCGRLLYVKTESELSPTNFVSNLPYPEGCLAGSSSHTCPALIQEDEFILCDLVSISKSPLKDADEVIKIKA